MSAAHSRVLCRKWKWPWYCHDESWYQLAHGLQVWAINYKSRGNHTICPCHWFSMTISAFILTPIPTHPYSGQQGWKTLPQHAKQLLSTTANQGLQQRGFPFRQLSMLQMLTCRQIRLRSLQSMRLSASTDYYLSFLLFYMHVQHRGKCQGCWLLLE